MKRFCITEEKEIITRFGGNKGIGFEIANKLFDIAVNKEPRVLWRYGYGCNELSSFRLPIKFNLKYELGTEELKQDILLWMDKMYSK